MEDKGYAKGTVTASQLSGMKNKEIRLLREECVAHRDIFSLLEIEKHFFARGSVASNENHFPQMCYYYGRLHQEGELQDFLKDNSFHLLMMSDSCKALSQNLLNIGNKFPNLNENEISYLEDKYCDSKTFELLDSIMFDSDQLSRPLKITKNTSW